MSHSRKRTYQSELRENQAAHTRSRILQSAKKLFEEKGFEKLTIGEIAQAAQVSPPTVYSLFKSKRGVLLALMDSALSSSIFQTLVEEVQKEKTARGKLCIAAKMTRQLYDAEQKHLGSIGSTSVLGPEFQKIEKEQESRRYHRQEETVKSMSKELLLAPEVSVSEARDILWALTGRDLYRLFVLDRGWSPDRYEAWLAETLIRLLSNKDQ